MYAAEELGLGSTWVGSFSYEKLREFFELPEYLEPVAMLPVGYPAESAKPSHLHDKRFELDKTVFTDSFKGIEPGEESDPNH